MPTIATKHETRNQSIKLVKDVTSISSKILPYIAEEEKHKL